MSTTKLKMHNICNDNKNELRRIYKYCIDPYGSAKDLTSLIETAGKDYIKLIRQYDTDHAVERASYYMIDGQMQYKALTSVYNTNYYGLMVRKDYWQRAYDEKATSLDPELYDTANEGYQHLTLAQFEEVMQAIKDTVEEITYPVTGYSWDVARTIGASCFDTKLNWVNDGSGNVIPYQLSKEYGELLELCRKWAASGIWEKDSSSTDDDTRTNNFLAGKHASYLVYPDVEQLIIIANRLKAYDDNSECMLIAPLKKDATIVYGNAVVGKNYKTYSTITDAIVAVKESALINASNVLGYYKTRYDEYIDWFSKNL